MIDLITYAAVAGGGIGGFMLSSFFGSGKIESAVAEAGYWQDIATGHVQRIKDMSTRLATLEAKEARRMAQRIAAGRKGNAVQQAAAKARHSATAAKTIDALASCNLRPRDEVVADIAFARASKDSGAAG